MIYKRNYLQFNDLVFDDYYMIEESDSSTSFKVTDHSYTFGHGSYVPFKSKGMFAESGSVSLTIRLQMKKLPCDVRRFYPQFVVTQLTTQGKLWAVQYNTLVWAYAYITNYNLVEDVRRDELKIDVDFDLPEGIWHKADKQRTFLAPYDKCIFMDCYHYRDLHPCANDCCHCTQAVEDCDCCYCFDVSKEMALCYFDDLQFMYDRCGAGVHIVYDCEAAERYFSGFDSAEHFGQKFCSDCGAIYGLLYSETEIPTSGIKITLHGTFNDPEITINDNTNIIKGSYEGSITIYPDGSVYYLEECSQCDPTLLDVAKWTIPSGMEYGWTVHAGNNSFKIEPNNDTCNLVCAYIEVDALTI